MTTEQIIQAKSSSLLSYAELHTPYFNLAEFERAIAFISQKYAGKNDRRGEPYIIHLLDVATICATDIGLEHTSLVAALLHNSIELGIADYSSLSEQFGSSVAQLVESYARIASVVPKDSKEQAELYRQMLITLSSDARVILIKLADRLAGMRALESAESSYRLRYATDTFNIWASLAHRLGLYPLKSEMEDLSMRYINPDEYNHIAKKLKDTAEERSRFIADFIAPIEKELAKRGFIFEVKGRTKSIYSIFKKMQQQNAEFEDVFDIFAIRIIISSEISREKSDCWQVYSVVTDKYRPNPERMRDWISVPKSNGYESLHTTVVNQQGRWVEVQIRTQRMDDIAERGLAAHWKYKGIKDEKGIEHWIERVREVLESSEVDPLDKVQLFQLELKNSDIYVFTPKGDIRKLPINSTVLDFAFDIHSQVGSQCVGAKVSGRNVPIKYVLHDGDVVEIMTSKRQTPKKDWLGFVVTSKAKARIKLELRNIENRAIAEGKEIMLRKFKNWKIDNPDAALATLCKHLKLKKSTQLFMLVAEGKADPTSFKTILLASIEQPKEDAEKPATPDKVQIRKEDSSDDFLLIDETMANIDYKFAKCCNPIFGDSIFGFVTVSEGIKIHRATCPNASQLMRRWGYRVVKAKWRESSKVGAFQAVIKIVGSDEVGMLNRISAVISTDMRVNMRNVSVSTSKGQFVGTIQLHVEDTKHLDTILYKLSQLKGVERAVRLK